MLSSFTSKTDHFYTFDQHTLVWIKGEDGMIEVDFKTYSNFQNKLIYLAPGQYLKFLIGEFQVKTLEFPSRLVWSSAENRVLFKHLISLGYIDRVHQARSLTENLSSEKSLQILDISREQWFLQNPFQAEKEEYQLIFDLKDIIDEQFQANLNTDAVLSHFGNHKWLLNKLVRHKLGLTIKKLNTNKLLLESQKEIAFTDKPIKAVAYDMGFRDPAYFNRFFKQRTRFRPVEFRETYNFEKQDYFLEDLIGLIQDNFKTHHTTAFYADQLHTSVKNLSKKVKARLNTTVGEMIRAEILKNAKTLLEDLPVNETAYELGFKEANHFSAFFKRYLEISPSEFQSKKYNK